MTDNSAFEALNQLASLSREHAVGLPAQVDTTPRWSGIGFSLLGRKFIAPMRQIAELLEVPGSITRLPGVHPWVVGLSNVRGRLLPLFDMAYFFGGKSLGHRKQQRVLVIETDSLYSGLIVDQAFGMQHFTADKFSESTEAVPEALAPCVRGSYTDPSGVSWAVFDMGTLVKDGRFINASLN
jgi:twitching motility protein PilI